MEILAARGVSMVRDETERSEVQVDDRIMQLLLTADNPEVSIGACAGVGPGARLPRLPALYRAKKMAPLRTI